MKHSFQAGKRRGVLGAAIVDVLLRARTAYDRAAALNARHRERDAAGERLVYDDVVVAVDELGRAMAKLQITVESGA
jgi:hypothetical protein